MIEMIAVIVVVALVVMGLRGSATQDPLEQQQDEHRGGLPL